MNEKDFLKLDTKMKKIVYQYSESLIDSKVRRVKLSLTNGFDVTFSDRKQKRN